MLIKSTRDLQHATPIESFRIVCRINEIYEKSYSIGCMANSSFDTKRYSYIYVVYYHAYFRQLNLVLIRIYQQFLNQNLDYLKLKFVSSSMWIKAPKERQKDIRQGSKTQSDPRAA